MFPTFADAVCRYVPSLLGSDGPENWKQRDDIRRSCSFGLDEVVELCVGSSPRAHLVNPAFRLFAPTQRACWGTEGAEKGHHELVGRSQASY